VVTIQHILGKSLVMTPRGINASGFYGIAPMHIHPYATKVCTAVNYANLTGTMSDDRKTLDAYLPGQLQPVAVTAMRHEGNGHSGLSGEIMSK
jgi:hypothetical protein